MEGGGTPNNPLSVTISNGSSSVSATSIDLTGNASCDNCEPPPDASGGCPYYADRSSAIGISWKNKTTGTEGLASHAITGTCYCDKVLFWLICSVYYEHTWSATGIPLALGDNIIEVTAHSPSGGTASDSVDIVRSNSVLTIEPLDGATNVHVNTTISVTFSANVDPLTVTSSSFMVKSSGGAAVSGNYVVNGPTVSFTPFSYLATNTLYVVNTSSGIKDTNGIPMAVDSWVFTTSASSDVTPPTISSTNPASGATGTAVTNPVVATFSEPMMASTINTNTFTLNNGVNGMVVLNSNTASFWPSSQLAFSTTYTATIAAGVQDLAGNGMVAPYSWSFTTNATPPPPTAISTDPANNASEVVVNDPIYATFSEPMDFATINTNTFSLNNGVTGTVAYDSGTHTAKFTPIGNLTGSTTYIATITSGVTEILGIPMAAPYSWSFTTGLVVKTMKMPDSGQIVCYDISGLIIPCVGSGQDGDYAINTPSYTDNGDGTVTDNVTGIVWQKQNDGLGRSWSDAKTYCSSLTLGGGGGWRLPSRYELVTVTDYGGDSVNYFPNRISSWSSTSVLGQSTFWGLSNSYGYTQYSATSVNQYAQCVRGAQSFQQLVDNGNGTITDTRTNLTWQRDENGLMDWHTSIDYCEALSLGGWNDWRLPNIKELASLVDDTKPDLIYYGMFNIAINMTMFPGATASYYWSSTSFNPSYAWAVYFGTGIPDSAVPSSVKTVSNKFRCVRGG